MKKAILIFICYLASVAIISKIYVHFSKQNCSDFVNEYVSLKIEIVEKRVAFLNRKDSIENDSIVDSLFRYKETKRIDSCVYLLNRYECQIDSLVYLHKTCK